MGLLSLLGLEVATGKVPAALPDIGCAVGALAERGDFAHTLDVVDHLGMDIAEFAQDLVAETLIGFLVIEGSDGDG